MEPWTILVASIVGSLHCATMCGPIAAVIGTAAPGRDLRARSLALSGYHVGRGIGYSTLGAVAGWLGAGLERAGTTLLGIADLAGLAMIAVLVVIAVRPWLPVRPALLSIGRTPRPPRLATRIAQLLAKGGHGAAPAIGLLTAVLPCGWLWSFVALAAATKSPASGALLMLAMWAGSLPALSSVGAVAGWMSRIVGARGRAIGSIALLVVAAVMLAGMITRRAASDDEEVPPCHRS